MKIGFFGGCFNPPTNAHIELSKKALKECNLDKVVFVPVGDFFDKKELVKAKYRYDMLKIACDELENIEVSDLELNVKERIYATDAFELIEKNYLGVEIFFIMGADNFINISKWKNGKNIIDKYRYIVLNRDYIDIDKYIYENDYVRKYKDRIQVIENEKYINHSSSKFRNLLKENKYNEDMIPDRVLDYIIQNGLYKP